MKISKNKKMRFFLMFQGSLNPKIRFLAQKLWSVARVQRDTQTHTKVNTEGTLSGFQGIFLQPIIKDRPNKGYIYRDSGIFPSTYQGPGPTCWVSCGNVWALVTKAQLLSFATSQCDTAAVNEGLKRNVRIKYILDLYDLSI